MKGLAVPVLLVGAIGLIVLLVRRRVQVFPPPAQMPMYYGQADEMAIAPYALVAPPADVPAPRSAVPAGNYVNEESWDIEWNKDGLPSKVTIHRNATRT